MLIDLPQRYIQATAVCKLESTRVEATLGVEKARRLENTRYRVVDEPLRFVHYEHVAGLEKQSINVVVQRFAAAQVDRRLAETQRDKRLIDRALRSEYAA